MAIIIVCYAITYAMIPSSPSWRIPWQGYALRRIDCEDAATRWKNGRTNERMHEQTDGRYRRIELPLFFHHHMACHHPCHDDITIITITTHGEFHGIVMAFMHCIDHEDAAAGRTEGRTDGREGRTDAGTEGRDGRTVTEEGGSNSLFCNGGFCLFVPKAARLCLRASCRPSYSKFSTACLHHRNFPPRLRIRAHIIEDRSSTRGLCYFLNLSPPPTMLLYSGIDSDVFFLLWGDSRRRRG